MHPSRCLARVLAFVVALTAGAACGPRLPELDAELPDAADQDDVDLDALPFNPPDSTAGCRSSGLFCSSNTDCCLNFCNLQTRRCR